MSKYQVKIKEIEKSQVEIEGEIPSKVLEESRKEALENFKKDIQIDGFRKGHVPEKILIEKVGDMAILNEMAELSLSKAYPDIIIENKIEAIGHPQISITKMAPGNPLGFKITVAVMPKVDLADYKKIAKNINSKKEDATVSEKELKETLENISKNYAHQKFHKENPDKGHDEAEKVEPVKLNDEIVKELGDFKDLKDFEAKIKEDIQKQKEYKAVEKKRVEILEEILKESKLEVPEIFEKSELEKLVGQIKSDIASMGLKFDDYLKHIKKTGEDLRKEFLPDAQKRAKTQVLISQIAKEEKIQADKKMLDERVKETLAQYKEAKEENVRLYFDQILTNEAVLKFLEEVK